MNMALMSLVIGVTLYICVCVLGKSLDNSSLKAQSSTSSQPDSSQSSSAAVHCKSAWPPNAYNAFEKLTKSLSACFACIKNSPRLN